METNSLKRYWRFWIIYSALLSAPCFVAGKNTYQKWFSVMIQLLPVQKHNLQLSSGVVLLQSQQHFWNKVVQTNVSDI